MKQPKENIDLLFGFPCRCLDEGSKKSIIKVVKSIRNHHPLAPIVLVDSNSTDKSYFDEVKKFGNVFIEDVNNSGYEAGAVWHIYENYIADVYVFLQDTLELRRSLTEFSSQRLGVFVSHEGSGWLYADQRDMQFARTELLKTEYHHDYDDFRIVQYNAFLAGREIMDKFKDKHLDKVIPWDKFGSSAMERIWGIALAQEGYEIEKYLLPDYTVYKTLGGKK